MAHRVVCQRVEKSRCWIFMRGERSTTKKAHCAEKKAHWAIAL
jgi:hypothetical protein